MISPLIDFLLSLSPAQSLSRNVCRGALLERPRPQRSLSYDLGFEYLATYPTLAESTPTRGSTHTKDWCGDIRCSSSRANNHHGRCNSPATSTPSAAVECGPSSWCRRAQRCSRCSSATSWTSFRLLGLQVLLFAELEPPVSCYTVLDVPGSFFTSSSSSLLP